MCRGDGWVYFGVVQCWSRSKVDGTLTYNAELAMDLSGRYSYKLLAKKRLPLQLQVTVLKSLAVTVTSYSTFSELQVTILVTIVKG